MPYKVAAIDIHKKVWMVVVATVAQESADAAVSGMDFDCRRFGAGACERQHLACGLSQREVKTVGMESTAQYWKPVWLDLEPHFGLRLAQAHSNRAPKGRKNDFRDAQRLARRFVAGELMLSFVPEPEQRLWRLMTRGRLQLVRERVRLHNQLEALLEEMRIKLSSVISDLLGASGRRMLSALATGETDPVKLAELGDERLRCTRPELEDALRGHAEAGQRQLLQLHLQRLELLDTQIEQLSRAAAQALKPHQEAVTRVAQIPGFGVQSAQQLIAEVGVDAQALPSADDFASWVGVCPASAVTAEVNHSSRSPKGNHYLRRIVCEVAQAAIKHQGCHFEAVFRRFLPKLGFNGALWVVAHRIARVLWIILHKGVSYIEMGESANPRARKQRVKRLTQNLRKLGYEVTLPDLKPEPRELTAT